MAKNIKKTTKSEPIVIDKNKGLIFDSEQKVYDYFAPAIQNIEEEYEGLRPEEDITDDEVPDFEEKLAQLFEHPDEVWVDKDRFEFELFVYIKHFESAGRSFYYLAMTYLDNKIPSFIFLHFPTQSEDLVEHYRLGEKIFSFEQHAGQGDALSEGDPLAIGLYKAMLTVRSESDISVTEFPDYLDLRDQTVEHADEIWKGSDLDGNTLVNFIKEFGEEDESIHYVVVTIEDSASETHYVLFSFPTQDKSLLARYRRGERVSSEEVVQEESH